LLEILGCGADFVIGDVLSPWRDHERAVPIITGKEYPETAEEAWEWLRNPLPPAQENYTISQIRDQLSIPPTEFQCAHSFEDLDYIIRDMWLPNECTNADFFRQYNPVLRHVVLRKRKQLEDAGLLERVGVDTHPILKKNYLYRSRFAGLGILTNTPFRVAYEKAEEFCNLLQKRTKAGGFMKPLCFNASAQVMHPDLKPHERCLSMLCLTKRKMIM
jgi:hypothetical protein